jgi:hypothetical protein
MTEYEFEIDGQKYFGNPVLEVGRLQKELAASQAREAKLRQIEEAAKNLIAVKGRHHAEQAYKRLEDALK